MKKTSKSMLSFIAGFIACVVLFVLITRIPDRDVNRFVLYFMDSNGIMDHNKLYVLSGRYDAPVYRLELTSNAHLMDAPTYDVIVNTDTKELRFEIANRYSELDVFRGRGFEVDDESGMLYVRGTLTGVGAGTNRAFAERLYLAGSFDKRSCGMGELQWRAISFWEALFGK